MEAGRTQSPNRARHGLKIGAVSACIGLTAAAIAAWFLPRDSGPRPVVETSLDNSRLGRFMSGHALRDLPFNLDMPERVDLAICLRLAGRVRSPRTGEPPFGDDDTLRRLEDVLKRRPDQFYAEYLLGLWHDSNGNEVQASEHYATALKHAPVVLVQPYEQSGAPLIGATIPTFQVECNRVRHGKHDSSLRLTFFNLTTDRDGCIRLPVYDTVYRLFHMSEPTGYRVNYRDLGWFESPGRVGLLPRAVVWLPETDRVSASP